MPQRRAFLVGSATGVLAACGGGAVATAPPTPACPAPPVLVGCFGDSLFSGGVDGLTGGIEYLATRPVRALRELLGVPCIDYSRPGVGVGAWRYSWPTDMLVEPSSVLVLRFGGADAIGGAEPAVFEAVLAELVAGALRAGKRVVLPGLPWMARKPEWQDPIGMTEPVFADRAARAAAIDAVVQAVALRSGASWVDIRALPFAGPSDIADAVHPAQAYSDRCVQAIAAAVRRLL